MSSFTTLLNKMRYLCRKNTGIMATITIRINERTSVGKAILQLLKANKGDVEILHYPNEETLKSMINIEKGEKITKSTSHSDLMRKLKS